MNCCLNAKTEVNITTLLEIEGATDASVKSPGKSILFPVTG